MFSHKKAAACVVSLFALGGLLVGCGGASSHTPGTSGTSHPSSTSTSGHASSASRSAPVSSSSASGKLKPLADGFPNGPITLWATFPVGHPDDLLNREVAKIAAKYSPVRLVPRNDVSDETALAFAFATNTLPTLPRAQAGYQIYDSNFAALAIRPYENPADKNYKISQLHVIAGVQGSPFAISVPKSSHYTTLKQIVAYAKAHPGRLRFVAGGPKSRGYLQMIAWEQEAGIKATFVPTSNDAQSLTTMLGGGAAMAGTGLHSLNLTQVRVLAVTGTHRYGIIPNTPTMQQLGYAQPIETTDGYAYEGYGCLASVPASHQRWIRELLGKVVADKQFQKYYSYALNEIASPQQVATVENQSIHALVPIIKQLGLAVK